MLRSIFNDQFKAFAHVHVKLRRRTPQQAAGYSLKITESRKPSTSTIYEY